jgi:hypothetical protein
MFHHSASFYDALYSFKDYGAAVRDLRRIPVRTEARMRSAVLCMRRHLNLGASW